MTVTRFSPDTCGTNRHLATRSANNHRWLAPMLTLVWIGTRIHNNFPSSSCGSRENSKVYYARSPFPPPLRLRQRLGGLASGTTGLQITIAFGGPKNLPRNRKKARHVLYHLGSTFGLASQSEKSRRAFCRYGSRLRHPRIATVRLHRSWCKAKPLVYHDRAVGHESFLFCK